MSISWLLNRVMVSDACITVHSVWCLAARLLARCSRFSWTWLYIWHGFLLVTNLPVNLDRGGIWSRTIGRLLPTNCPLVSRLKWRFFCGTGRHDSFLIFFGNIAPSEYGKVTRLPGAKSFLATSLAEYNPFSLSYRMTNFAVALEGIAWLA